ncbi:MCE family protein [Nocardioides marmorisolisilvae]|uniref:MCE family protein n=1 Tax=Nocardioides marmorisolisilvae TaxID=1542737 RepID=A0A3N0DVC4_9ACTN|nr:MCE family protein [Nocardioides marmorisolisilvae]RNL79569.1 MCE family protein [Nocardioides marmorisolisilvae]
MAQAVRKELTRRDLAVRGLAALVVLAIALTLLFMKSTGSLGGPKHVSAELRDAGGSLAKGADVKVRGVIVGRVTGIGPGADGGVRVNILISQNDLDMVPANVVARILPATVFGTSFVDLVPPKGSVAAKKGLRAGAVIPADKTQGTLELQQALDDIDSLVKAVGPAELASAIGSAAQALDGRGIKLGKTIDVANAYLAKLNPKMPLIRDDVRKLAENLELAQQVAPDLFQATNDALVTARTIVDEKASLATLISGGLTLTTQANTFVKANSADLIRFIDNSARLLDVVYANRHAGITEAFLTNKLLDDKLKTVLHDGFLNSVTTFNLDVPPYYTRADCPRFGAARGDNCTGAGRVGVSRMLSGGSR